MKFIKKAIFFIVIIILVVIVRIVVREGVFFAADQADGTLFEKQQKYSDEQLSRIAKNAQNFKAQRQRSQTLRVLGAGEGLYKQVSQSNCTVEHVQSLVTKGADVNYKVKHSGKSVLMLAASKGREDIVNFLLKKGADAKATDRLRQTPLHYATQGGSLPVVQALVEKGANINARDMKGRYPLDVLAGDSAKQIAQYLLHKGARYQQKK